MSSAKRCQNAPNSSAAHRLRRAEQNVNITVANRRGLKPKPVGNGVARRSWCMGRKHGKSALNAASRLPNCRNLRPSAEASGYLPAPRHPALSQSCDRNWFLWTSAIGIFLASSTDSALCCAYKLALANKIGNEANQNREFVIEKAWFLIYSE